MTSPPEGFRAHDRRAPEVELLDQGVEGAGEARGLHVIGIAAEPGVLDPRVGRLESLTAATAPEVLEPAVPDSACLELLAQRRIIEMRMPAGGRIAPDVGQALDPVPFEKRHEIEHREVRVPHGPGPPTLTLLRALRTLSFDPVSVPPSREA